MGGASLLLPIVEQPAVVIAVITMMRMRIGSRLGMERGLLGIGFLSGCLLVIVVSGLGGLDTGGWPCAPDNVRWRRNRTRGHSALARWVVGRDPADEPAEVPDEALVDAALWHLLGPVLVHQLAGQHHAVVRAGHSAEGVHVDADERAVGTERRCR